VRRYSLDGRVSRHCVSLTLVSSRTAGEVSVAPEKILADDVSTPVEPHAVRNPSDRSLSDRVRAGLVMSGLTLALMAMGLGYEPADHRLPAELMLPAALIATIVVAVFSSSARAAWGRLCLINGMVSVALGAASVQVRGQPLWPTDPGYEYALDQGTRWWLKHEIWTGATYFGGTIIVAAVLFALSYWLLRSPHARHRGAH
jgi:hypothetical protein